MNAPWHLAARTVFALLGTWGVSCTPHPDGSPNAWPDAGDASVPPDAGVAPDASTCGSSYCESELWPRLAVVFGNPAAAGLTYTFTTNKGISTWTPEKPDVGFCPAGYGESAAYHCDIGFEASRSDTLVTVTVEGWPEASVDVPLEPFNYCGNGMAELTVSTDDAGVSFDPVHYVNVCGL